MKKGRTRFLSPRFSLLRTLFVSGLIAFIFFGLFGLWTVQNVQKDLEASLPRIDNLPQTEDAKITRILSSDGQLVATLFKEHYKPIKYDELGSNIVNAVVAIEDRRFFEHDGVDLRGVARAAVGNALSGSIEQGASTITMQLARHLYLSDEKSYERKIREALLARKIEREYDKTVILERYLNEVYFGSGAHGVGAAASRYFGTTPEKLSVAESALLAGLIQSPTYLNPLVNHRGARHRQVEVLTAMREADFISGEEFREAMKQATNEDFKRAVSDSGQPMLKYPYFTSYAAKLLIDEHGESAAYGDGLTVRTTLDRKMQKRTADILKSVVTSQGPAYNVRSGAAVVIENETGYIRAMVGGLNWRSGDQFNRAWQAQRQPGSTFKPLLYAAALELGYTQESLLNDNPVKLKIDEANGQTKVWAPHNYDGKGLGKIPMREALRRSRNQATVDLLTRVGVGRLTDMARRLGIKSELPRVPSLALGSGVVTPLEMAQAYAVFANNGIRRDSTAITTIEDSDGRRMSDFRHPWSMQATSAEAATQTTEMLRRVVTNGTGRAALIPGLDTAGKTGTTDSYKDAWFVGYTPKYTVCVWMGNDDNSPTYRLSGGSLPAVAWRKIVASLDHQDKTKFAQLDSRVTPVKYCLTSHKKASAACKKTEKVNYRTAPPAVSKCSSCKVSVKKLDLELGAVEYDPLGLGTNYPKAK